MNPESEIEKRYLKDIKRNVRDSAYNTSEVVCKSAYAYLLKSGCLNPDKEEVARVFFQDKLPTVLTKKMIKELNFVLGLDLDL